MKSITIGLLVLIFIIDASFIINASFKHTSTIYTSDTNAQIGYFNTNGESAGLAYSDSVLYVADQSAGLTILNVSNIADVSELGSISTSDVAWDVQVQGNYAYVAANKSGLRVVDISNPQNPTEVGHYDTPGSAQALSVKDKTVFIADWDGGVRCINISDPTAPEELGHIDGVGHANDLVVESGLAYVAAWDGGLWIVNVTNPNSPVEISNYPMSKVVASILLIENYAYMSSGLYLKSFDISDAENPQPSSQEFLWDAGNGISFSEESDIVCVACGYYGVEFIDAGDPENLDELNWFSTEGFAAASLIEGHNVFIAEWDFGIRIVDLGVYLPDPGDGNSDRFWSKFWNIMKWVLFIIGVLFLVVVVVVTISYHRDQIRLNLLEPIADKVNGIRDRRHIKLENKSRLERLRRIIQVSEKVEISTLTSILGISKSAFIEMLSNNQDKFGNVKISGNFLVVESEAEVSSFIDNLDNQFDTWNKLNGDGKKVEKGLKG